LDRTCRAVKAIADSSVVAGYTPYIKSIADLTDGKEIIVSGMRQEVERCRAALIRASEGAVVSMVSSGDPGVYGMAGLILEMADSEKIDVTIEIIPGISAANTAASRLGAPLMLDYACISLSDLMVSWDRIRRRIELIAEADMVLALYNPRSIKRISQLEETVAIMLKHRPPGTRCGIVTAISTREESVLFTTLGELLDKDINMRSLVVIGNSDTREIAGRLVTTRGYRF